LPVHEAETAVWGSKFASLILCHGTLQMYKRHFYTSRNRPPSQTMATRTLGWLLRLFGCSLPHPYAQDLKPDVSQE